MNAVDLNARVLEHVGCGEEPLAIELFKQQTVDLAKLLDAEYWREYPLKGTDQERAAEYLTRTTESNELFLAVAFPLIEYGGKRSHQALSLCLVTLARATAVVESKGFYSVAGVVVIGRTLLALATYALHCGRTDGLLALGRARVVRAYDRERIVRLVTSGKLLHPEVLGMNAERGWLTYTEWLNSLDLIRERYQLFAADLNEALEEADLVLALCRAGESDIETYCHALGRRPVLRLRSRLMDSTQRAHLLQLFKIPEEGFKQKLQARYEHLRGRARGWEVPTRLFPPDETR